jgi:NTP pyrophosphatase (non-canonical NTP hydrolase)
MSEIKILNEKIDKFIQERDWKQFQAPKDLAISIVLEAAEVLEHFQFKNGDKLKKYIANHKEELGDELADTFIYLLRLAGELDIDLIEATYKKINKNITKYPIEKFKGLAKKYNEI